MYRSNTECGGRPNLDVIVMFKSLFIQQLYSLSDELLEREIADRISFRVFLGTPDGRPGVNILICNMGFKNLENSFLFQVGQCVLTALTAAAFSGMLEAEKQFDTGKKESWYGDGFQKQMGLFGR